MFIVADPCIVEEEGGAIGTLSDAKVTVVPLDKELAACLTLFESESSAIA